SCDRCGPVRPGERDAPLAAPGVPGGAGGVAARRRPGRAGHPAACPRPGGGGRRRRRLAGGGQRPPLARWVSEIRLIAAAIAPAGVAVTLLGRVTNTVRMIFLATD